MLNEIEVQLEDIVIANYILKVFDKQKGKLILNKAIDNEELAKELFDKQVNIYHKLEGSYTITLYDMDKCTNIDYYDTDDQI